MSESKNIMSQHPLTLAQIISLCGFLIVGTFYITRIYSQFENAEKERLILQDRIEYVNDRLTKITSRNSDAIKKLKE